MFSGYMRKTCECLTERHGYATLLTLLLWSIYLLLVHYLIVKGLRQMFSGYIRKTYDYPSNWCHESSQPHAILATT